MSNENVLIIVTSTFCIIIFIYLLLHKVCKSPLFLIAPPLSLQICQMKCLFSGTYWLDKSNKYDTPLKVRIHLIIKWFIGIFFLPLWDICMLIDDIFYPQYRKIDLSKSIFLVGAFRTGSTSLHRQLFMDENRYVSPHYFELFFPFLCVYYFNEKLCRIFGKDRMKHIYDRLLHIYFQKILGPEVILRHPMTGYEAEEDDLLLGSWQKVGWYAITGFPHPKSWMNSGKLNEYSEGDLQKTFLFYERTMQKIMYYRSTSDAYRNVFASSNPPVLLSKSHLIGLMPIIKQKYKDAKIVGIVRHPKDAFTSWYALAQAALDSITNGGHITPTSTAVEAHLQFWDHFTQQEMNFFKQYLGKKTGSDNREWTVSDDGTVTVLTSKSYFSNHVQTIEKLYENWGTDSFNGSEYQKRLNAETSNHKSYKKKKLYKDPSLTDLGISDEYMTERYSKYIDYFELDISNQQKKDNHEKELL